MTDREMLEFCFDVFDAVITAEKSKLRLKKLTMPVYPYSGTTYHHLTEHMHGVLRDHLKGRSMIRVHCWADGPTAEDGCGSTCMLPDGHEGPHQWTRDDEVKITFFREENNDHPIR